VRGFFLYGNQRLFGIQQGRNSEYGIHREDRGNDTVGIDIAKTTEGIGLSVEEIENFRNVSHSIFFF
jgi:hypothetical protein